ncbi:hypothetical protein ACFSYD_04895 [Paracoccus aerius]
MKDKARTLFRAFFLNRNRQRQGFWGRRELSLAAIREDGRIWSPMIHNTLESRLAQTKRQEGCCGAEKSGILSPQGQFA